MRRSRRTLLVAGSAALSLTLVAGLAVGGSRAPAAVPSGTGAGVPTAPIGDGGVPVTTAPVVVGPADPAAVVEISLALRGRDPDGLAQALAALSDPTDPAHGQVMTPAQFGDRFGLAAADEDRLVAQLTAQGLTVTWRNPQRISLHVQGTVADLERLLGVSLEQMRDVRTGAEYVAASGTLVVPDALTSVVTGIIGLDSRLALPALLAAAPAPPTRGLAPQDLAAAYDYASLHDAGITGDGQNIAILQFGQDTDKDLAVFDAAWGITGPDVQRITVGAGVANAPASFASEAALDTQVVRAVAPGAQILVYGFENNVSMADAVTTIVNDGKAKIISLSYGKCFVPGEYMAPAEVDLGKQAFAAAALAGVTMFAATGDWGAFTCHVFDPTDHQESTFWPACTDNVVGVGGTYLETRDDGSYLRETGWEHYLTTAGAGGGISPVDPMPAWQQGAGVQNDRSTGNRQCPDVGAVADADSGYLIFVTDPATGEAAWQMVGGTSAAAPFWAGITALMQQAATQQGLGDLGFLAPRLYRVAADTPAAFHDVVRGGNLVSAAGPGWDYSTGIGTPDVAVLTDALIRDLKANP